MKRLHMLFTKRRLARKKQTSADKSLNAEKIVQDSNRIILDDLVSHLKWDVAQKMIAAGIADITAAHLLPAIVCLACGGKYETALQIQAGWTLLSYGIKVHDDLLDAEPTKHPLSAREQLALSAILMDLAYVAMDMATISDRQYRVIVNEMALAKTELMLAQAEKISADASTESYFAHILRKSGNYFSSACKIGALATDIREEDALFSLFARLGVTIGMAIQTGDDIMDIADDIRYGHFTLPILLAIQAGDRKLRQLCDDSIKDDTVHADILHRIDDATTNANKLRNVYIAQSRQTLTELGDHISDVAIQHLHTIL